MCVSCFHPEHEPSATFTTSETEQPFLPDRTLHFKFCKREHGSWEAFWIDGFSIWKKEIDIIITVRKGLQKETESLIMPAKGRAFCTGDDKSKMKGKEGNA